jgi:hypothetical protein
MASIRKKLTGFEARIYNSGKPVSRTFKTELEAQHWASSVELGKVPAQENWFKAYIPKRHAAVTRVKALIDWLRQHSTELNPVVQANP